MDRLDELAIFVAVAEQSSFIKAARKLGRSAASVTRAIAALEDRLALRLFNRTTRAVALTDSGARYLDLCRRALAEVEELELSAASERLEHRGVLTLTAPEMFGRLHLLPIAQDFMRAHPQLKVTLLLLNRMVSFIDEGIDLGLRIAHLQDSSLQAIQVGSVRRVVCASPGYLGQHGLPETPQELAHHDCIAVASVRSAQERWSFGAERSEITVQLDPRLVVNTVQAAIDAAISGFGVIRPLSYQSAPLESEGRLRRILAAYEPPPIPIHLVHPAGRYLAPKVRLFIDFAVAVLRGKFAH